MGAREPSRYAMHGTAASRQCGTLHGTFKCSSTSSYLLRPYSHIVFAKRAYVHGYPCTLAMHPVGQKRRGGKAWRRKGKGSFTIALFPSMAMGK